MTFQEMPLHDLGKGQNCHGGHKYIDTILLKSLPLFPYT